MEEQWKGSRLPHSSINDDAEERTREMHELLGKAGKASSTRIRHRVSPKPSQWPSPVQPGCAPRLPRPPTTELASRRALPIHLRASRVLGTTSSMIPNSTPLASANASDHNAFPCYNWGDVDFWLSFNVVVDVLISQSSHLISSSMQQIPIDGRSIKTLPGMHASQCQRSKGRFLSSSSSSSSWACVSQVGECWLKRENTAKSCFNQH